VQVWASFHDISRPEFAGVVGHMGRTARHVAGGPGSVRYLELLRQRVL